MEGYTHLDLGEGVHLPSPLFWVEGYTHLDLGEGVHTPTPTLILSTIILKTAGGQTVNEPDFLWKNSRSSIICFLNTKYLEHVKTSIFLYSYISAIYLLYMGCEGN